MEKYIACKCKKKKKKAEDKADLRTSTTALKNKHKE